MSTTYPSETHDLVTSDGRMIRIRLLHVIPAKGNPKWRATLGRRTLASSTYRTEALARARALILRGEEPQP